MPSPNQRTGRVWVKVNGQYMETLAGAKLSNPTGFQRSEVIGSEVFGYTEAAMVPTVDCEFAHSALLSTDQLWAITDGTITFQCDTGVTYVLRNAWCAAVNEITGGQGKVGVKFMARKCEEQRT